MAQGPLSRYLGRRDLNEAANMQGMGLLARIQAEQQARAMNEQFRRDQLAATVYGREEARKSREAIAEQNRLGRAEVASGQADLRRELSGGQADLRRELSQAQIEAANQRAMESNALRRDLFSAKKESDTEKREAAAQYAESLSARLRASLGVSPRSTTGLFSPVIRGVENVANAFAPGSVSSDATVAAQTKEQLITVLTQMRGGGSGRLSNQDMRRIDTAIGQINSGTPEGMMQGLSDVDDLIDVMRGKPARSMLGQDSPPAPRAASPGRKPLSSFDR